MADAECPMADEQVMACPSVCALARGHAQLRRVVPDFFELDLFDGEAWVGMVPYMTNVGLRAAPALPWLSAFPELSVRTYVRVSDWPGVYFSDRHHRSVRNVTEYRNSATGGM